MQFRKNKKNYPVVRSPLLTVGVVRFARSEATKQSLPQAQEIASLRFARKTGDMGTVYLFL